MAQLLNTRQRHVANELGVDVGDCECVICLYMTVPPCWNLKVLYYYHYMVYNWNYQSVCKSLQYQYAAVVNWSNSRSGTIETRGRIYKDTYEFVSLRNGISPRRVLRFVVSVRI